MKIGLMKAVSCLPDGDAAAAYREFVDLAVEAERLGYYSLWTTEHHLGGQPPEHRPFGLSHEEYPDTDYDLGVDLLTLFSHVSARTTRLRMGTALVVLLWDDPLRVAERAAMVDLLSGGRLDLGVGRGAGFRTVEYFKTPTDNAESLRKFEEAIEMIRLLWTGEPVSFDGEFYQLKRARMVPKPARQPAPIFVGTTSLPSVEWAGRQGLPYLTLTYPTTDWDIPKQKRRAYMAAASEAGQDVSQHPHPTVLMMHCGETDAEAEEWAYRYILQFQYIIEQWYQFGRQEETDGWPVASVDVRQTDLRDKQFAFSPEHIARWTAENHIVGSPQTCLEKLEALRDEIDLDYAILNVGWGNQPYAETLASVQRFAQGVLPKFTGASGGVAAGVR